MHQRILSVCVCSALAAAAFCSSARAAIPADQLLPNTTAGFVSVADTEQLSLSWDKTQLGQLMQDPVMKPFAEDLKRQFKDRWTQIYTKLGLTLDDLDGVPSGELAMAMVRPGEKQSATALLVDVTGNLDRAQALLAKIDRNLTKEKATKKTAQVLGATVTTYTLPKLEDEDFHRTAVFFINDNVLCGVDHAEVAKDILGRFSGEPDDNLASVPGYRAIMNRVAKAAGDLAPEARWFVEPFSLAQAMRDGRPPAKRRHTSKNILKILEEQGFDAVQGLGGYLNLYVDNRYEFLHRTAIYAPPVAEAQGDERYLLAARLLRFPNAEDLSPQPWVPRELASYLTLQIEADRAFEYSKTLVDKIIGEPGIVDDIIHQIKTDPNGPQIDLVDDLIAHLGQRVTMVSDFMLPITPKSERTLFAVETTNEKALAETIRKTMEKDPDAHRRVYKGHVVWEIIEQQNHFRPPGVELGGDPLAGDPLAGDPLAPAGDAGGEEKKGLPNSAVCVANGHLFVATHYDFLKKALDKNEPREMLAHSADYRVVVAELGKLAPGPKCVQFFSRTEEEYRGTYELIRTGRMPEAETMLGKALNALFTDGKEGELRKQSVDGTKLPQYETIRRYFGPAGFVVESEENGWFITGSTISKQNP